MQCAISTTKPIEGQDKFAHRLRVRLLERGMTLTALARRIGCHRNSIRLAEHGLAPGVRRKLERFIAQ